MNILILLFFFGFVIALFVFALLIENWDFISPVSIVLETTLLSLIVLSFFIGNVGVTISVETMVLVFFALLSFTFGSMILRRKSRTFKVNNQFDYSSLTFYSFKIVLFCFVLTLVATYLYYREVKRISIISGFSKNSLYGMLYYYRTASLSNSDAFTSQSKLVGQFVVASFACSYLILVDFTKRIVFHYYFKDKNIVFFEILTIIIFIGQCILSGGRTQFLYFIESFVIFLIFYLSKRKRRQANLKLLRKLVGIVIFTFIAFFLLGTFTGKTNKLDFSQTLFIYAGSSFIAFDKLIHRGVFFKTPYPGSNVLLGIIDIMRRLGLNITQNEIAAPFVTFNGLSTNVYGSYARYYNDFGILGMILICFILGLLYKKQYLKLLDSSKNIDLKLVIYAIVSKVLFDFCIEERFFISVLSIGTVLRILYVVLFYYIFSKIRFKKNILKG